MTMPMTDMNITNFRKDLFNCVDSVIRFNEPINLWTKNGNAVLISKKEFDSLMEALYISSIPGLRESLVESMNAPQSEFISLGDLTLDEYLDKIENGKITL